MKIYMATCRQLEKYFPSKHDPLFTHDDLVLVEALRELGFIVLPFVWDEDSNDVFKKGDVLIFRSTWNYMESPVKIQQFENWVSDLPKRPVTVLNSSKLIQWNFQKTYLQDLQAQVPVVETRWLEKAPDPVETWNAMSSFVLKPQRAAAAKNAFRVKSLEEAERLRNTLNEFSEEVLSGGWMVQPYLKTIETKGELSLVFFQGEYSHCVLKKPAIDEWRVQDELGGTVQSLEPNEKAIEIGKKALDHLPECPFYARVDLMCGEGQEYFVGEVELIEPELFFLKRLENGVEVNEHAVNRFCQNLKKRIHDEQSVQA